MIKKRVLALLAAGVMVGAAGCSNTSAPDSPDTSLADEISPSTGSAGETVDTDDMFTDRDKEIGYDESACTAIRLTGSSATCDNASVTVKGSTVTITGEGEYLVTGSLTNGSLVVNAAQTDKVRLILGGVTMNCDTSAALYVKQADKVFVTLAKDSVNTLSNKQDFISIDDNNIDAVLFSKEDLTINGLGSLTIQAAYGHGIVSKDDLVITGGVYTITAARHGLQGKDSIRVADGTFAITSGKDGLHAENTDDADKGFVYIAGGSITVTAATDGIDASSTVQIDGGTFKLTTGGGSANASTTKDGSANGQWGFWGGQESSSSSDDTASAKGIKCDGNMQLQNGTFTIDSSDDSIHSNGSIAILGGRYTLSSGDDGVHADTNLKIEGGEMAISKSYEGLEGQSLDITGGNITLTASDDGINAAGGSDQSGMGGRPGQNSFTSDSDSYIKITGGILKIDASGDGIDSNGNLYVTGGEVYVNGPTSGGNGALDYDGDGQISGGVLVAVGSNGMAQNFGASSTQGSMLVTVSNHAAGDTVALTDSAGNVLVSFTPSKAYASVVISCPELKKGETYTLTAGSETVSVEMASLIIGSGSMGGGGMGGGRP